MEGNLNSQKLLNYFTQRTINESATKQEVHANQDSISFYIYQKDIGCITKTGMDFAPQDFALSGN